MAASDNAAEEAGLVGSAGETKPPILREIWGWGYAGELGESVGMTRGVGRVPEGDAGDGMMGSLVGLR